ncbi:T9SS C-terminal target domain-containing protein [candidate division KSB1 bacterium]|nr:T9SS type A sorting domain-containing protein [candidate division KSB1 bacterium]RQW00707.1 MAG: T9SS C-terminal target domain-containing protein [candidate division KSB1 bacterium]
MERKMLPVALLCILGIIGCAWAQEDVTSVLLVVGDDAVLNEGDQAILDRLETVFGFAVDLVNHETVDSTWAEGMAFVYVSSTVSSGTIADKMKNVPVPVIMIEPYAQDDMGMTLDTDSLRFYQAYFRDMLILDETHFLAAGLSGEVIVSDNLEIQSGQGVPNENGTIITEFVPWEEDNLVCNGTIYCYEKGALLADTTVAAERRYFGAWNDVGVAYLTEEGLKLWDASINWCLYKDKDSAVYSHIEQPKEFALAQNYPNPFNPSTNISFSLQQPSFVMLTVSDLRGRIVASLADGQLEAGEYYFTFDASGLASGVYIYTLSLDSQSISKKMTLLR